MKRHFFGTLGALVAIFMMVGCVDDPTAALRGGVNKVLISRTHVEFDVGATYELEASAIDSQGNVLGTLPEVFTTNAAIVSLEVDTIVSGDPLPRTRFKITGEGAGQAGIYATAGGVTSDTTDVIAYPLVFDGAVAIDQSGPMDVITISATEFIKFDTNAVATLNEGQTYLMERTAEQLVVQSLSLDALTDATLTISNLVFLGSSVAQLDAETAVSVRAEPNEPANDDPETAPVITPGFTFLGSVGDGGFDDSDWYRIDLAAATDVTFTAAFPELTDIDLNLYDATLTRIDYSWYDNPEQIQTTLAAGTYYLWVRLYGTDDPVPIWYDFSYTSP